ncbi:MAG: C40 family peptidase [Caulobacteraceae bacterium]|nr:C40 family peptidase [Caulobacteraceae bacterium]
MSGDPRLTLARPGLATASLQGVLRADRFAEASPMQLVAPMAPLRAAADPAAEQLDQLLAGELFDVLEIEGAFAWGQARRDGYVGFVEAEALSGDQLAPTHWVTAPTTFAFAEASIRSPAFGPLSLNALVTVAEQRGPLARAVRVGWIPAAHLAPVGWNFTDAAAVAERFLGAPYLWGGRSGLGLDCSGLLQQALYARGQACPRDADQQAALGEPVAPGEARRGDLVFWRGHAGILLDQTRLLHANAHHMAVAIEPLSEAVARIAAAGVGEPTAFRRP